MGINTELIDEKGRTVRPVLLNTAKDGSGTWYFALLDSDGHLQVDTLSGGGGTQYAVDAALGATPTGTAAIAKRDDALGALTPVEGDAVELRVDGNGALWTHDDALDAALSGSEIQVDVVAALPAGTNAIGKLAANSGVDIGDVDVTSVPAPLNVTGTGLEATALRVTLASDSTGLVSVDDNGGSLTVDVGTALPAGTNAIGKLAANTGVDIGDVDILSIAAGDNNIGNVDIASAIPAGTNAIGKLAANSGVDIGDVDILSIAAGTNQIGARSKAGLSNSGVKSADAAIKASAGDVYWMSVSDTAALAIELNNSTDNTGTDLWAMNLPANAYAHFIFDPPIEFSTGIYLDVSTATCKVTIGYK